MHIITLGKFCWFFRDDFGLKRFRWVLEFQPIYFWPNLEASRKLGVWHKVFCQGVQEELRLTLTFTLSQRGLGELEAALCRWIMQMTQLCPLAQAPPLFSSINLQPKQNFFNRRGEFKTVYDRHEEAAEGVFPLRKRWGCFWN